MLDRIDQRSAVARDDQLRLAGLAPVSEVKSLVFNQNNAATAVVERLVLADGTDTVRKVLLGDGPTTVPHWAAGDSVAHWNHWRRESDAYLSTDFLPSEGVRAPKLLGHVAAEERTQVLFLEHVDGRSGAELGEPDLVALAEGLGRWQGHQPPSAEALDNESGQSVEAGGSGGSSGWWSRNWIWDYARSRPPGMDGYLEDAPWKHPLVVEGFGNRLEWIRRGFAAMREELGWWQRVADRLPTVRSHLDCWANNAVIERNGVPVLFDWSFCGLAHIGADAGNLVPDGLLDHYGDPQSYGRLQRSVGEAYLSGLSEAGWKGAEEIVWLGMCLAPLKFCWLPALMVANAGWSGPTGYGGEQGVDHLEVFRRRALVFEAMLDSVERARKLVGSLGIEP